MIRRFNRYELKYIITSSDRDRLLPTIEAYMQPDREGGPAGTYRVTSLYYDSADFACYRSKLDGINYRRKLRIRRYGALETAPGVDPLAMVEIKQRINRTTQKRRLATSLSKAYELCEGISIPEDLRANPLDRAVAEEVLFLAGALQLRPTVVIAYRRQAFAGSAFEPGLRITFDSALTASDPSRGLAPLRDSLPLTREDGVILEVKANDVVPLWVSRLLAANRCTVRRFSKYCAGVARLYQRSGAHGALMRLRMPELLGS
ncbi:MAG: polyphosphate polymerase domain-containing protein [Deltaproteobacteria bacterium]|nr:polyphosphate polymerase domain-containing protein [Deltaproteobacteria bacterium]